MTYVLLALAGLYLAEKAWKHWLIVRFFRRPVPPDAEGPRLISVLQPVVTGDPHLSACLEANLRLKCRWPLEHLYLIDEDDPAARPLCEELIARHPGREARILATPPPPDRVSPKTFKLMAAVPEARGDVLCVLDDDTVLTDGAFETCLPYLAPDAGLAFGLPYYVSFDNLWSGLVAGFVNSHSLLTYVPAAVLAEPVTINGMFYVFRRAAYDATGGFAGVRDILADDFAVALHFRRHGLRLAQTPVRHPIRTHVSGPRAYLRLLHRWFVFPRETLMKGLPWRTLLLVYGLTLPMMLIPLLLLAGLCAWPSWQAAAAVGVCFAAHFLSFAHCNVRYLRRATPWRWSWLVPLLQVLLPLQILAAFLLPQRVNWRGNVCRIEKGGGFRYERRRSG
jgi:ceramide glucosyltransferase